jgi:hypothetical protein
MRALINGKGAEACCEAAMRHTTNEGTLIWACRTRTGPFRKLLRKWDNWRAAYCYSHRGEVHEAVAEGKVNPQSIAHTIAYMIRETKTWHKLKPQPTKAAPKQQNC